VENGQGTSTALMPPPPARPDAPGVTWHWWEAVVVFLIGAVAGGIIALPGAAAVDSKKWTELILSTGGEIGLGGTAFLWLWALHRRTVRLIGVPENPAKEVGVGALAGVGLYAGGVFLVGTIVALVLKAVSDRSPHAPHQLPTHLTGGELLLAGITVIVVAPVAEELFFRGFLVRSLRAHHSFAFAGVVSALCFGAVHYAGGAWQNALLLPIVMSFVGFGLAALYERRRNIVANMAAHSAFNVIGFLFIAFVFNK
jgi:membrane protease YdiL (CAAX protease family)